MTDQTPSQTLSSAQAQIESATSGLIELTVRHRRVTAVLQSDPAVSAVVAQTPEFQQAGERIVELIEGPEPSPLRRVTVSMMLGGIYYATTDPRIAEVGDAELHRALVVCARPLMVGPPAVG